MRAGGSVALDFGPAAEEDTDEFGDGDGYEDDMHALYDVAERDTDPRFSALLRQIARADDPAADTDMCGGEAWDEMGGYDETAIYADPNGFDEAAGVMAEVEAEEEEVRAMGKGLVDLLREMKRGAAPPDQAMEGEGTEEGEDEFDDEMDILADMGR